MDCHRCILRERCHNVVWGKGPVNSKIMFVGEAPTDEDELLQEPFMSREGKVLRRLISQSSLASIPCYFTFAVKCPLNDCKALEKREAIAACRHWLNKEIAQLGVKVVVTLGRMPTSLLLTMNCKTSLNQVLGVRHQVVSNGINVFPWYAPAHILQHGKKCDKQTVSFFNTLCEFTDAIDSSVVV